MVTIKEIAKACNLSATAVSKALRGHSDISKETTKRVKKIAKEMGYSPNAAAVRLRTNRSYTIGILMRDEIGNHLNFDFFSSILNHFLTSANKAGYTVIFISKNLGGQNLSHIECVRTLGCDGILVLITDYTNPSIIELLESPIPLVTIDYVAKNKSSIQSDNSYGLGHMVRYAHSIGHRKIAMVHGCDGVVTRQRLQSFKTACDDLGLDIPPNYIIGKNYHDPLSAEKATYELLNLQTPPTFIFYQDDFAFIGCDNALKKLGLSYPKDISVAGYDGQAISQVMNPKLMTWSQNTKKMGEKSWEVLQDAIENPKTYSPKIYQIKGEFLKGESSSSL